LLSATRRSSLAGRAFISFQTAAELRYGAIRCGWGEARMLKLDSKIRRAEVVHTGPELVAICAQLRANCAAIGHALAQPSPSGSAASVIARRLADLRR
jgi:hypothetical protein